MNRKRLMRLFCALLCAALLFMDAPADMLRAAADDAGWSFAEAILDEAEPAQEDAAEEPEAGEATQEPSTSDSEAPDAEAQPAEEASSPEDSLDALAEGWVADMDAQGVSGDYARALWLYDALIANFERGSEADGLAAMAKLSGAPLGYALAYEALLRAAGIESRTVDEGGAAWNLAKLDGEWTHIDAYADDAPDCYGTHFGLSDAAMTRDHGWSADLPACEGIQSNYFVRERGYRAFDGSDALRALLASALEAGERELYLYNAGEALSVAEALPALLEELDPEAEISVSEKGCYAAVVMRTSLDFQSAAQMAEGIAAKAIVPSVDSLTLGKGETASIGFSLQPEGAREAVVIDANPRNIVTGDQSGNIVANKTGKTTLTLTTESGLYAEVKITVKKAPTKISMVGDRTVLGVGESMQVGYKLSSGSAGGVTFSIPESQQEIATVTEDGLVTAKAPGSFSLSAETYNHKKAKAVTIEVKPAPTRVVPPVEALKLGRGDHYAPQWSIDEGSAGKLSFSSSNPSVARVDPDSGEITALEIGDAVITASAYGAATGAMPVTVAPQPTALELSAENSRTTIGVKEQLQLIPTLRSDGELFGGSCTVAYKSSKTSVASVSADGVVTAKKAGKATITGTAFDGQLKATIPITVKKAPTSVSIVAERTQLGVDEQLQLGFKLSSGSVGTVRFSIPEAQQAIATVTEDGLITAHAPGQATVTAETHNKKKKTLNLEICAKPESIEIVDMPASLGEGSTGKLVARLNAGSAGALRYRISEFQAADGTSAEVASIDTDGTIHALIPGTATAEITTYVEGLSATAQFSVVLGPREVLLDANSIDLGVGATYQIVPEAAPEGSAATYTYKSSKKSCATVGEDGLVTGKKTGKAVITVKAYNDVSNKLTVNVKKAPSSVSLSTPELTLGIGEKYKLEAKLTKNSSANLTYASANEDIATVAPDGTVTAVGQGQAVITVTTHNNKTARCTVTVVPAPTAIYFEDSYSISLDQENFSPSYRLEPENAHASLTYELVSGDGIQVVDNRITAVSNEGEAVIRANTQVEGVYADFPVIVVPVPEEVYLPENFVVQLGSEGARLEPTWDPVEAVADLSFKITGKKKDYFDVDPQTGWITPRKKTTAGIEVTVTTHNGKSAKTKIWVLEDLNKPVVLEYRGESPCYVDMGKSFVPDLYVFPEEADPNIQWSSSNYEIASVDSSGVIDGLSPGRVTITGASRSNSKLSVKFKVVVLSEQRCLVMPDHRTKDPSTIDSTKSEILDVRDSAYAELEELVAKGWISEDERIKRKGYVDRAFEMYNFAWTPNAKKYYWKAANSEGGHKDFKVGTYYFGMPYTQSNRTHSNLNKYTTPSTDGYDYRITTNSFKSRSYPGSDCSSYCSMAVWGFSSGRKGDTTSSIASASYYKTPSSSKYWADLRPGDLICAGGHHVVMFLYYTNTARTQFVVIEQGGGGDDLYSNCVSTSIRDKTYYTSRGYKIRRVKGLDTGYME